MFVQQSRRQKQYKVNNHVRACMNSFFSINCTQLAGEGFHKFDVHTCLSVTVTKLSKQS